MLEQHWIKEVVFFSFEILSTWSEVGFDVYTSCNSNELDSKVFHNHFISILGYINYSIADNPQSNKWLLPTPIILFLNHPSLISIQ